MGPSIDVAYGLGAGIETATLYVKVPESGAYVPTELGKTVTLERSDPYGFLPDGLNPPAFLGESLSITGEDGLTFTEAVIVWPYDPANLAPGTELDTAYCVVGGVVVGTYPAAADAGVLTIQGVDGFSDWYAGNGATNVVDWSLMAY